MSFYRQGEERTGPSDIQRPVPTQNLGDRNGRMYQERYSRSNSRDQHLPSSSSSRRYASPHDRHRTPPPGKATGFKDPPSTREWDARRERENVRSYENPRGGRSPSPRRGREGYQDRDREEYRSPAYDSRSRSRSRSPHRERSPYYGAYGRSSADALNPQILKELKQYHDISELEDVRVIRDRQTKISRGFGFLRFPSLEKSRAFVERNYPTIHLYGKTSVDGDNQAAKVRIAFSRERDDRSRNERAEGEWTCKICTFVNFPGRTRCFRCQTPQIDMAAFNDTAATKPVQYLNSGDSDVSPDGIPSQFLILRGLEPTVTEDLLAKGVAKLYKPTGRSSPPTTTNSKKGNAKVASTTGDANLGAKEGSIRRVLLVRDRRSNESWRYGFAEFGTVDDAQAALIRFNSFEKFTISSKRVTANYIHAGVFVPVFNTLAGKERFIFSPLGNTATKLAYWDEEAYASELVVSLAGSERSTATLETQARSAADRAAAAAENEGLLRPGKETDIKAKKRKAEATAATKAKKTAPAHLQFWSNRHAELHSQAVLEKGLEATSPPDTKDSSDPGATTFDASNSTSQSYTDPTKKCCYLCSRQFKSEPEVSKHERLSQLHRDNLTNPDLKAKALVKLSKAGLLLSQQEEEDTPEYRDRARERRAAFNTKKISLPLKKASSANGPTASQDAVADDKDSAPPVPSKGASLLGKMGWSAGEGLGAQGTGMTTPIATDMYVQGVGLGAVGGKLGDAVGEAERNTRGDYGEFLERTRDRAKERFERMG